MRRAAALIAAFACSSFALDARAADMAIERAVEGSWASIACELRPGNPDENGVPTATWLERDFSYDASGSFDAVITLYADPLCDIGLAAFDIAGSLTWHDAHPVADGAKAVDYTLDRKLEITPLAQPFLDQLQSLPPGACGDAPFALNEATSILGEACVLLNVEKGAFVQDFDLLYVRDAMLFMGAKHVDGSGFYLEENRPQGGLQVPLAKVE